MEKSDAVKIWEIKLKALAVTTIGIIGSVALWQGHNSGVIMGTFAAIAALAGVKIFNKVTK